MRTFTGRLANALARRRVLLGFLFGVLVIWIARPTWLSLAVGAASVAIGEALRIWAAGHIEKSREVTSSGPYRHLRHPLYVGSSIIGIGLAIASHSLVAMAMVVLYLATAITAAVRLEEAHLREKFGGAYDAYAKGDSNPVARTFSLERALRNREHHTVIALIAAFTLLALKVTCQGS